MKQIMTFVLLLLVSGPLLAEGLYLESSDVHGQFSNEQVFNGFGCTGENISPDLTWGGEPAGTKSFALTVYDPDAPTGSGWWHWVVFNIPKDVHTLKRNAGNPENERGIPGATQGMNSYGFAGFGGACPPKGDKAHRYIFTVFALDTETISQGPDARPELVGFFLNQHAIQKASIMAYYGR
jgi:Raf kinase inhibitor-like YbhB/YbcL family protein